MGLSSSDFSGVSFSSSRRGYDPAEVDAFLRSLAKRADEPSDADFGQFGDEIAGVLRSANETATAIRSRAEADAAAILAEAEAARAEHVERRTRAEADAAAVLADAESYAADSRRSAAAVLAAAEAEADELRSAAHEAARQIRVQAEDDAQRRADALLEAAQQKVDELATIEAEIRTRIKAASIEIQRMAEHVTIGDGVIDLRDRRRPEPGEHVEVSESRAVWDAVGNALKRPDEPQSSSAS